MQEADAREAERQFDQDLGESLDRQKVALAKTRLTLWQRVRRFVRKFVEV